MLGCLRACDKRLLAVSRLRLHHDEEVLLQSRPRVSLLFPRLIISLIVLGACSAAFVLWRTAPSWFGLVLLGVALFALGSFLASLCSWRSRTLTVTSSRVLYRAGVWQRVGHEISIDSVTDVTYRQSLLERLLRTGTLSIESGTDGATKAFPDIRRPQEAQSLINRAAQRGRITLREDPPEALGVSEQLGRLEELHRLGVITAMEFEHNRAELLRQL